jgi:hypothetical protein
MDSPHDGTAPLRRQRPKPAVPREPLVLQDRAEEATGTVVTFASEIAIHGEPTKTEPSAPLRPFDY